MQYRAVSSSLHLPQKELQQLQCARESFGWLLQWWCQKGQYERSHRSVHHSRYSLCLCRAGSRVVSFNSFSYSPARAIFHNFIETKKTRFCLLGKKPKSSPDLAIHHQPWNLCTALATHSSSTLTDLIKLVWMVLPSLRSSAIAYFSHSASLVWRQVIWSRVFDLACGFWRINVGMVIAALMEKASNEDSLAKASKRRASSATKRLPLPSDGT